MDGVEPTPGAPKPDSILVVDNIVRQFGGMTAVDVNHLEVQRGIITALIGPNGAGKTTLFNLLTGQLRPNDGQVRFRGRSIGRLSVHERVRLGLGRTFQVVRPLPDLTVLENTMMGAFLKHRRRADAEQRAYDVLEKVGLGHVALDRAGDLPLARRKRLLKEHKARRGDPAVGGSTRQPIMTAYRQRALACAAAMRNGPKRPRDLKPLADDAGAILLRNVYGWFERVDKGVYRLTEAGEAALAAS